MRRPASRSGERWDVRKVLTRGTLAFVTCAASALFSLHIWKFKKLAFHIEAVLRQSRSFN